MCMALIRMAMLALLLAIGGSARAGALKVAVNTDKPPFAFREADGSLGGIEVDLLRTVLARCGELAELVPTSKTRLLVELKAGRVQAAMSVRGRDDGAMYFSDPMAYFENVAVTRKSSQITLAGLADLDRHQFVIWHGGWADLGPAFAARYQPGSDGKFPSNYFQASNQVAQARIFWARRVDVMVVDRNIFDWLRRKLAADGVDVSDELVFHSIVRERTGFSTAFASRALRDCFNQQLRVLRDDGSYQRIVDKYKWQP